jgi:Pirin C-terminal cupin domain
MVQLWVNLRAKDKSAPAGYQTLLKAQIPKVELPQDVGDVRVIAGEFGGRKGAAKTFTPINVWDVNLRAGKSAELPLPDGHTTIFLVLSGEVEVNGKKAGEGDLAIFERSGEGIDSLFITKRHQWIDFRRTARRKKPRCKDDNKQQQAHDCEHVRIVRRDPVKLVRQESSAHKRKKQPNG